MSLLNWVPVIVSIVTALAAVATYAWNKRVDRKHALIDIRRSVYRDYVLAIADVSHSANGKDEVQRYKNKLAELHLIASDEVLLACAEFTALYRLPVDPGSDVRAEKYASSRWRCVATALRELLSLRANFERYCLSHFNRQAPTLNCALVMVEKTHEIHALLAEGTSGNQCLA